MARPSDVVRIASALPGAVRGGSAERLSFEVEVKGKRKGFCWSWLERVHPKKARVPNLAVLAVRVRDAGEKARCWRQTPTSSSRSRITTAIRRCWCACRRCACRSSAC
jgi:hypothetical protein